MKRLISWLLALTLICGLLPMSVFAEEVDVETDTGSDDFTVDMSELIKTPLVLGTNEVSLEAADADGDTWTYTAEKDMTLSVELTSLVQLIPDENEEDGIWEDVVPSMFLSQACQFIVNDVNVGSSTKVDVVAGDKVTVQLIMNSDYAANAVITLAEYVPPIELNLGENAVAVGNYAYTVAEDGVLVIALTGATATDDTTGETMDITAYLAQQISMGAITLMVNDEQIYAPSTNVNVYTGDVVSVVIDSTLTDFAGTLELSYAAPGSAANPFSIEWIQGDGVYTASVTIPANTTYYYYYYYNSSWPLTIAENPTYNIDSDAYVLSITNGTDAEATYNLTVTVPAGEYDNPVVIEDMNDYSDTQTTAPFYYIWTATEEGTVTLDMTDGYQICATHISAEDGAESYYYLVEYNWETYEYEIKENLTIEVAADDQIKIEVTDRDDSDDITSYTLTGDFEGVEVAPVYEGSIRMRSAALNLLDKVAIIYKASDDTIATDNTYVAERGVLLFASMEDANSKDVSLAKQIVALEWDAKESRYVGQTEGIDARDMADSMFAVGYLKMIDGTYIFSTKEGVDQVIEYSPLIYCKGKMNDATVGDLACALMHYGAAAQAAQYGMTEGFMNEGFPTFEYDETVLGETVFSVDSSVTNGIKLRSAALDLKGAISYIVKFTVEDTSLSDKTMYAEYTLLGETGSVELTLGEDGRLWATISGIAAKDMGETLRVRGYYLDDNGEKVYGAELVYSGYEYTRRTLASASSDTNTKNLAMAFAMYIYEAYQYAN